MQKIKVAELFYSLQGEGKFISVPSVFLRTFGCNFTCSGFGMPRGEKSQEHILINPTEFKKYDDLPLVHTGCDSYASWDVRFKHLSPVLSVEEIAKKSVALTPYQNWSKPNDNNDIHFIFTGGESLLGWQRTYPDLLSQPEFSSLRNITFETNGTQEIQQSLLDFFNNNRPDIHVTFSVSAKLSVSGENWNDAILPNVVAGYSKVNNSNTYLKFVIGDIQDLNDVIKAVEQYKSGNVIVPIFLMPVGGTNNLYHQNTRWVAEEALKHGFRYSPRIQVDIWKNAWGT